MNRMFSLRNRKITAVLLLSVFLPFSAGAAAPAYAGVFPILGTGTGSNSMIVGDSDTTKAGGANSVAVGKSACAGGTASLSVGYSTVASNSYAMALGSYTSATGQYSTAIGYSTTANSTGAAAMGYGTLAGNSYATAMGYYSRATGYASVAMGYGTNAAGSYSTASGSNTCAAGNYSFAGGSSSKAYEANAFAFGSSAVAGTSGASNGGQIAMGNNAAATGAGTVAIGNGATTSSYTNSVALGAGSTVTANNTVAVGSASSQRRIMYVANGEADSDAVNFGQLKGAMQITGEHNYYGGGTAPTEITDAVNAVDAAAGKVDATGTYNIISAYTPADGSTPAEGTTAQNLVALDTKLGKAATTANGVAEANTFAQNIDALNTALGNTAAYTSNNYVTNGSSATAAISTLDSAIGARQMGSFIGKAATNTVYSDLKALDNASVKSLAIGSDGKITATRVDNSTANLVTDAIKDRYISGGTYDAANKKITFTYKDQYSGKETAAFDVTGISSAAKYTAASGGTKTVASDRVLKIVGNTTKALGATNISTSIEQGFDGNATIAVALGENVCVSNVSASGSFKAGSGAELNSTALTIGTSRTVLDAGKLAIGGKTFIDTSGSTAYIDANNGKITNVANGAVTASSKDAVNGSQLYGAAYTTRNGNYYNGSSTAVKVAGAVDNLDAALGKTTAGNYIAASDALGTNTIAAQINKLDAGIGEKLSSDGNVIRRSNINTINQNISALDTAIGSRSYTYQTAGGGFLTNGQTITASFGALNNASVKSLSLGSNGKITATRVDGTTTNLITDAVKDRYVASVTYNAAGNKITFTEKDTYDTAYSRTFDVTGISSEAKYGADSGATATVSGGKILSVKGGTTAGTSKKNIATSIAADIDGNAEITVALDKDVVVNSVTAGTGTNQLVADSDGLKVGSTAQLTAAALTVGTSALDADKLAVGGETYVTAGSGINANSHKIVNVANGSADSDAVNYGQYKNAVTTASYTSGVLTLKNAAGTTVLSELIDGGGAATGAVVYDDPDTKTKVTLNAGGSGTKITNLAAGTENSDAVNYGQLNSFTRVRVGTADVNSGSGIELVENGGIELTTDGSKIKIKSLGTADPLAVRYDKDTTSGARINSLTLKDSADGTAAPVAVKNVASAGDLTTDNNSAATGGDIFKEVRAAADGRVILKANTAAANVAALDTAVGDIKSLNTTNGNLTAYDGTGGTIAANLNSLDAAIGSRSGYHADGFLTNGQNVTEALGALNNASVKSLSLGSNGRITAARVDGTTENLVTDAVKDRYVESGAYNAAGKKITFTEKDTYDTTYSRTFDVTGISSEAKYGADSGSEKTVASDKTLSVVGGATVLSSAAAKKNVTTTIDGDADGNAAISVALNPNVEVDTVKTGAATLDSTGLTITGTGSTTLTNSSLTVGGETYVTAGTGINANNHKIIKVANGTDDTDAVNYGQVKTAYKDVTYDGGTQLLTFEDIDGGTKSVTLNVGESISYMTATKYNNGTEITGAAASAMAAGAIDGAERGGAVAIGYGSEANRVHSTAIGYAAAANADEGTSVGYKAAVSSKRAVAAGSNAQGLADNAIAIGADSTAQLDDSVALGSGADTGTTAAGKTESVTVGAVYDGFASGDAVKSVVSVGTASGTRKIINVAAGEISAASLEAVNGSQLYSVMNSLKVSDGDYIEESKTAAANLTALDTAIGKTADGNYIVATDAGGTNTIAAQIQALDTKLGKVTTTANGVAEAKTFAANLDALNITLGNVSGVGGTYANTGVVATDLKALDTQVKANYDNEIKSMTISNGKITAARNNAAAFEVQTEDYVVNVGTVNNTNGRLTLKTQDRYTGAAGSDVVIEDVASWKKQIKNFSTNASGKVTAVLNASGGSLDVAQLRDYRVTSAAYNASTKKATFTVTDAYGNTAAGSNVVLDLGGFKSEAGYGADNGTAVTVASDKTLSVKGGTTEGTSKKNIATSIATTGGNAEIKVTLDKDVVLDTLAANAGVTSAAYKVGTETYITSAGINANNHTITNVAAGSADTDAVNYGQYKNAVTTAAYRGGVLTLKNAAGGIVLHELVGGGGGVTGAVVYDDPDTKTQITLNAAGSSATKITNLEAGEISATSKDAVNGGQLYSELRPDDGTYVRNANTTAQNLLALDGQVAALTGGTAELKAETVEVATSGEINAGDTKAVNGGRLYSELRPDDGTYVRNANTTAQNLLALDGQVAALTGGTAELKAETVEVATSGEINAGDTKAVNGSKLYAELKEGADGNYIEAVKTTAANLKELDTALKPIDDVVAAQNYDGAAAAKADGAGATAIGWGNVAGGERSTAVGFGNVVTGARSGAFGDPNIVTGDGSYAIGNDNTIANSNTFVLGSNVTTTQDNSVILGSGSTDRAPEEDAVGVVSVGSETGLRQIINVAAGTQDTDAVNVKQLNDAIGSGVGTRGVVYDDDTKAAITLGTGAADSVTKITRVAAGEVSPLSTDAVNGAQLYARDVAINANTQEIREVGAISAALAGLHYVEPTGEEGDKLVGAVAYGNYRGESAGAIGVAYKPNPNFMLSASTSVGQNQNAYNAGASLKFGKGETAVTRAALQKQVKFVNEENKVLKTQVEKLSAENAEQGAAIRMLKGEIEELKKLLKK